jgi:hypothetical protein
MSNLFRDVMNVSIAVRAEMNVKGIYCHGHFSFSIGCLRMVLSFSGWARRGSPIYKGAPTVWKYDDCHG